jgi:hypothetical protein
MSIDTTVMICGLGVEDKEGKINEWLESKHHFGLSPIIESGGEKGLNVDILQGSFDHFELDWFIEFLESLEWECPTDLFIMEEDDTRFKRRQLDNLRDV